MTNLLVAQAEIRARYRQKAKQPRAAGKFVTSEQLEAIAAARLATKQALRVELAAKGLLPQLPPPGCTMVKAHKRQITRRGDDRQPALLVAA